MTDRYDACVGRPKKDGGTHWTKIGALFKQRDKDGYQLVLDALPLTDSEGRCTIVMFPPRQEQRNTRSRQEVARDMQRPDYDDEIPL